MTFRIPILLFVLLWTGIASAQSEQASTAVEENDAAAQTLAGEPTADMPPAPYAAESTITLPESVAAKFSFSESGPLISLERAHQLARKNNPSFHNVEEQIYQSDCMIQSAWSMLLPNLSANAKVIRNKEENTIQFPIIETLRSTTDQNQIVHYQVDYAAIPIQKKWQASIGFTANVTLFNARSIPLIQNAYDLVDQQKLKAQIARNDLLFAVTSAYYQIANLKELVYVYADNLNVAKETLRMAEARKLVGQGTKIDVMRAQIHLKDKERTLQDAIDAYITAKKSLAFFLGIKGEFQVIMPRQIQERKDSEEALTESALKNRVELKSAEMDVTMARRWRTETKTKFIPKLDATWQLDVNSSAGLMGDKVNWMLIFAANWSILEGGARIAELNKRASEIRIAENQIDQLKLDIQTDVNQKVQEKISKQRNLEVTEELVALAEENHNMISRQYQVGMANSLELTDASNELANQKVMLVMAKLQYELALLTLGKTIGEYSSLPIQ